MLDFTWRPDWGTSVNSQPKVTRAQFGDGYEQRTAPGLNTNPKAYSVRFSNRTDEEGEEIEAFLEARNAVEAFRFIPPKKATSINVVCRTWSVVEDGHNRKTITATFDQVFEP
jgi:phage-related protein